jgi:hypothetical protein
VRAILEYYQYLITHLITFSSFIYHLRLKLYSAGRRVSAGVFTKDLPQRRCGSGETRMNIRNVIPYFTPSSQAVRHGGTAPQRKSINLKINLIRRIYTAKGPFYGH